MNSASATVEGFRKLQPYMRLAAEKRASDEMQWTTRERRGLGPELKPEPCQDQPWWKAPPPFGTTTGITSGTRPSALAADSMALR